MPADTRKEKESDPRRKDYVDFLTSEGYRPEVDDDGDVRFKVEGRTYYILVTPDDKDYFRLVFPNFWKFDNEEEQRRVIAACDRATGSTKVVKVYTADTSVWAAVELFMADPLGFKPIFRRCLSALQYAVRAFQEKVEEQTAAEKKS